MQNQYTVIPQQTTLVQAQMQHNYSAALPQLTASAQKQQHYSVHPQQTTSVQAQMQLQYMIHPQQAMSTQPLVQPHLPNTCGEKEKKCSMLSQSSSTFQNQSPQQQYSVPHQTVLSDVQMQQRQYAVNPQQTLSSQVQMQQQYSIANPHTGSAQVQLQQQSYSGVKSQIGSQQTQMQQRQYAVNPQQTLSTQVQIQQQYSIANPHTGSAQVQLQQQSYSGVKSQIGSQQTQMQHSTQFQSPVDTNENKFDIMISYNHQSQEEILKIKNGLTNYGYKVWIDVEQMIGHVNERVAEAIDNSSCILICMTNAYRDSPNCRKASSADSIFSSFPCF
jgi:hypothetical protein